MAMLLIAFAASAAFVAPKPIDQQRWIIADDYPDFAFNAGLEGAQRMAISVDAQGRPTACKVTMAIGSDKLRNAPCRLLMKRARFEPAKDSDGSPIASVATYGNSFTLPGRLRRTLPYDLALSVNRLPEGLASSTVEIAQLVGADGTIESCSIAQSSGSAMLDDLACRSAKTLPAQQVGADGRPTRTVVSQAVMFLTADQAAAANP